MSEYVTVDTTRSFFMYGVLPSRSVIENCPCPASSIFPSLLSLFSANCFAVCSAFLMASCIIFGFIEFKGKWYLFYHNAVLTLDGHRGAIGRRSVCVDELHYNDDGTMQTVKQTRQGVSRP